MNVYRVIVDSEKSHLSDVCRIQATVASAAISKALRRTKHNTGKRVGASCVLLARNTTLKDYKEPNLDLGTLD